MRKRNSAQSGFRKSSTIEVERLTLPGKVEGTSSKPSPSVSTDSVFSYPTFAPKEKNTPKPEEQDLHGDTPAKTQYIHREEANSGEHTCFVQRPGVDAFKTQPLQRPGADSVFRTQPLQRPAVDAFKTQPLQRPGADSVFRTQPLQRPGADSVFRTQPISRDLSQNKTVPLNRTIPIIRPGSTGSVPTERNNPLENTTRIAPIPKEEWPLAWLVAISGPMKGKFFVITSGENYVGKARDNSICLIDDPDVSARQNCIYYDAEYAAFYIDACPYARQMTRLSDGDTVKSCSPLEHGEILQVSPSTKLRFVPFCGETFNW